LVKGGGGGKRNGFIKKAVGWRDLRNTPQGGRPVREKAKNKGVGGLSKQWVTKRLNWRGKIAAQNNETAY